MTEEVPFPLMRFISEQDVVGRAVEVLAHILASEIKKVDQKVSVDQETSGS